MLPNIFLYLFLDAVRLDTEDKIIEAKTYV